MGESPLLNRIGPRVKRFAAILGLLGAALLAAGCGEAGSGSASGDPTPKTAAGQQVQDEAKQLLLHKLESLPPEKRDKMRSIMGETLIDSASQSGAFAEPAEPPKNP